MTTHKEEMTAENGDMVTVHHYYTEDGKPNGYAVFVGGWKTREFKTAAGLNRYLTLLGARPVGAC